MIKHITVFALFIIVSAICRPPLIPAADIRTHGIRLVLDPGHGGMDQGLTSPAGLQEYQVAMELAGMIADALSDRFDVVLTRKPGGDPEAEPASNEDRAVFANQNRADAFISIHLHQARTDTPYIFCFDLPQPNRASPWQAQALSKKAASKRLARLAAGRFQSEQDLRAEIYDAPLLVMEGLMMPGILVEPFSLSRAPADPKARQAFLRPYARTLANAVSAFLNGQN